MLVYQRVPSSKRTQLLEIHHFCGAFSERDCHGCQFEPLIRGGGVWPAAVLGN